MLGPGNGNEITRNRIQAGPCKLLTNHKTALSQKYGLEGEGNEEGPKSGPGVEWYGGDAAYGSVLLAPDRPSTLSLQFKIIDN